MYQQGWLLCHTNFAALLTCTGISLGLSMHTVHFTVWWAFPMQEVNGQSSIRQQSGHGSYEHSCMATTILQSGGPTFCAWQLTSWATPSTLFRWIPSCSTTLLGCIRISVQWSLLPMAVPAAIMSCHKICAASKNEMTRVSFGVVHQARQRCLFSCDLLQCF